MPDRRLHSPAATGMRIDYGPAIDLKELDCVSATTALGFASLGAILFLGANEAQSAAMLADDS